MLEEVYQKFREYCQPRKNTVYERYRFLSRDHQEEETIDQWITELQNRAQTCKFGDLYDHFIRDKVKVVFGTRDQRTKERLLREASLTLQIALDTCRAEEVSWQQLQDMTKPETPQLVVQALGVSPSQRPKHLK